MKPKVALSIAGSDPSGGAGIQADLKTFHQFGVYGQAAITLLTVQNTVGVYDVRVMSPELISAQIDAVISDIRPDAIKTGALGNAAAIEAVISSLKKYDGPIVIDPVMVSKHGAPLLDEGAIKLAAEKLFPLATLVTPNIPEAQAILKATTGDELSAVSYSDLEALASTMSSLGDFSILIKGGHRKDVADDLLFSRGELKWFEQEFLESNNTHGTGCTLSSAITALLALGIELDAAVFEAKRFITEAIRTAPDLGGGIGPVNHFAGKKRD